MRSVYLEKIVIFLAMLLIVLTVVALSTTSGRPPPPGQERPLPKELMALQQETLPAHPLAWNGGRAAW
ncbi:MAG: hypothetical protein H7837_06540 [Magnetococcus sp. MYC-9]